MRRIKAERLTICKIAVPIEWTNALPNDLEDPVTRFAAQPLRLVAIGAIALVTLSGCANEAADSSASAAAPTSSSAQSVQIGTLINVRTAEEYAAGHLEGAINIDVTASDFQEKIADLDKSATYTLYCRSGKRAEQAAEIMRDAEFADVTNAGGYEEASSALDLPIVTD